MKRRLLFSTLFAAVAITSAMNASAMPVAGQLVNDSRGDATEVSAQAGSGIAVPEPSTLSIFALMALASLRRRRSSKPQT